MINAQMLDYIREQLHSGVSVDTLRAELAKNDWSQADIESAFHIIDRSIPLSSLTAPATYTPPTVPAPLAPLAPLAPNAAPAAPIATEPVPANIPKIGRDVPRKSTFWIWTTLWLTASFDALWIQSAISSVLYFTLRGLLVPQYVHTIIFTVFGLISISIGSMLAGRYVVRHSVVMRSQARSLATYAIAIPLVFQMVFVGWVVQQVPFGAVSAIGLLGMISYCVASLALMHGFIHDYIYKNGDS